MQQIPLHLPFIRVRSVFHPWPIYSRNGFFIFWLSSHLAKNHRFDSGVA